jgi:alkylation response protein AidB-like acyl-CoA dehydrogenase
MRFNEEQIAFRDSVRKMVAKDVAPIAAELDETDRFPTELAKIFGEMGLLQLWVPEEYGGPGGNLTTVCIAREEVGKASLAAATLCANNALAVALPVLHFGTDEQKRRLLPLSGSGKLITSTAMTEPQTGSDVASMRTRAVRDKDGDYSISGHKSWITWAANAHYVLVFARTSDGDSHNSISAFLVDTQTPGFSVGKKERKMGRNGAPNHEIFLDNVFVAKENMIGAEGQGFKACMRILDLNRPAVAASSLGLAQGALDVAIAYARERVQFGRPVGQFQGMQFKLADMAIKIEASRALLYSCCEEIDAGDYSRLVMIASMTKCFVTDVAMEVTTEAVQVLGSYGYSKEFPVERMMRDAKVNQIIEGTNEIHRSIIGRRLVAGSAG